MSSRGPSDALGQRIGDAQAWVDKGHIAVEVWAAELDVAQVAQQQRKIVHGFQIPGVRNAAQFTTVEGLLDGCPRLPQLSLDLHGYPA